MSFRLHIVFLLLLSWPLVTLANSPSCQSVIQADSSFQSLPAIEDLFLPTDFLRLIKAQIPEARGLSYKLVDDRLQKPDGFQVGEQVPLGAGENVVFGIAHLRLNSMFIGEHIAAKFIAKILAKLYPKAIIEPGEFPEVIESSQFGRSAWELWSKRHPGKLLLHIGIQDSDEGNMSPRKGILEMKFIKPAAPGAASVSRFAFRKSVGLPENHHVISLYFKNPYGSREAPEKSPSFGLAVEKIIKALHQQGHQVPDVIFLSAGGLQPFSVEQSMGKVVEGYQILKLSEWAQRFDPEKKWIVYNDLRGYMPHILNMSNLAVVSGPINIMEPLSSGAPLVFFNTPESITGYNPEAFDRMAQTALKTGGAYLVRNLNEFETAVRHVLGESRSIHGAANGDSRSLSLAPYLVPLDGTGLTPADLLLRELLSQTRTSVSSTMRIMQSTTTRRP